MSECACACVCQMTYWNHCGAVCLLPQQHRLLRLALSLSLSLSLCLSLSLPLVSPPLSFPLHTRERSCDHADVKPERQAGRQRNELVCGLLTNLLLRRRVSGSQSPLAVSVTQTPSPSSPSLPSAVLPPPPPSLSLSLLLPSLLLSGAILYSRLLLPLLPLLLLLLLLLLLPQT